MPLNFQFEGGRKLVRELNADRLNRILDEIRRAKPLPGRGITTTQEANGVRVDALNAGGTTAGVSQQYPWDIYVTQKNEGNYTVAVRPGLVGGLLPENWDVNFEVNAGDLVYGVVTLTTDGKFPLSATISMDAEYPEGQEAMPYEVASTVQIVFGMFKDGRNFNFYKDLISATPKIVWVGEAEAAQPGQSPYELLYKLQ